MIPQFSNVSENSDSIATGNQLSLRTDQTAETSTVAHSQNKALVNVAALELAANSHLWSSKEDIAAALGIDASILERTAGVYTKVSDERYTFHLVDINDGNQWIFHSNDDEIGTADEQKTIDGNHAQLLKEGFIRHGLRCRRDISIEELRVIFPTLPVKEQRAEFNARCVEEQKQLLPDALPIWFWEESPSKESLKEKILTLDAMEEPVPALPEDMNGASVAEAYSAVLATFNKKKLHSFARPLLDGLNKLCIGKFDAQVAIKVRQEQQQIFIEMAEQRNYEAHAIAIRDQVDRCLPPFGKFAFDERPWVKTFECILRQDIATLVWSGTRKMTDDTRHIYQQKGNALTESLHLAINKYKPIKNIMTNLPMSHIKPVKSELTAGRKVTDAFEKALSDIEVLINEVPATYRKTVISRETYKMLREMALRLVEKHTLFMLRRRVTNLTEAWHDALRKLENETIDIEQFEVIAEGFTEQWQQSMEIEHMPILAHLHGYFVLNDATLEATTTHHQRTGEGSESTKNIYHEGLQFCDLMDSLGVAIITENWSNIFNTTREYPSDWLQESKEAKPKDSSQASDGDGAEIFLHSIIAVMRFTSLQMRGIATLPEKDDDGRYLCDKETADIFAENITLAITAFEELAHEYRILTALAGESPEDDLLLASIKWQQTLLKIAHLGTKEFKQYLPEAPGTSASSTDESVNESISNPGLKQATSGTAVDSVDGESAQAAGSDAGTKEDAAAQSSSPSDSTSATNQAALAGPVLRQTLDEARACVDTGLSYFAKLESSRSQSANIILVRNAQKEFKTAERLFASLTAQAGSCEDMPDGFPALDTLAEEHKDCYLWQQLMQALDGSQRNKILWLTDATVAQLRQDKGEFNVVLPDPYLEEITYWNRATGEMKMDRFVRLEIHLRASVDIKGSHKFPGPLRKTVPLPFVAAHIHIADSAVIEKPADLFKLTSAQILASHFKPKNWEKFGRREELSAYQPAEKGAGAKSLTIPRCALPKDLAIAFLQSASTQSPKAAEIAPPGAHHTNDAVI